MPPSLVKCARGVERLEYFLQRARAMLRVSAQTVKMVLLHWYYLVGGPMCAAQIKHVRGMSGARLSLDHTYKAVSNMVAYHERPYGAKTRQVMY
jgi:hypothetical protein